MVQQAAAQPAGSGVTGQQGVAPPATASCMLSQLPGCGLPLPTCSLRPPSPARLALQVVDLWLQVQRRASVLQLQRRHARRLLGRVKLHKHRPLEVLARDVATHAHAAHCAVLPEEFWGGGTAGRSAGRAGEATAAALTATHALHARSRLSAPRLRLRPARTLSPMRASSVVSKGKGEA